MRPRDHIGSLTIAGWGPRGEHFAGPQKNRAVLPLPVFAFQVVTTQDCDWMRWRLSGAISEGHLRGSGGGVCGVTARRCGPSGRPCRVREHARCCACSRGPAGHANLRYGRRVGRALKLELSVRTTHALDLGPGLAARADGRLSVPGTGAGIPSGPPYDLAPR